MARPEPLTSASRRALLQRARVAIAQAIGAPTQESDPASTLPDEGIVPDVQAGAFVTLRVHGQLRGCVGYPEPSRPLVELVEQCAVSAAISDPRFPSLTPAEWRNVELEISVLGPIVPVGDLDAVQIGRDGLIAELGSRRGLLLPQVATEWHWNAREFASQTCVKAGLPRDAWQTGAKLFKFDAEVFGE